MKSMFLVTTVAGLLAGTWAYAQSGTEIMKAKGCYNCHDADKKKVGPALKDIAAKHKDDKGAEARLVEKLKSGAGHPKIAASDAELKAAVGNVLSTK